MLDLFSLFRTTDHCRRQSGENPNAVYLFLGDYVDRGHSSIETFAYLAYLKNNFPLRFFLLRGNHESREVNQNYGLYVDVQAIYGNSGPWYLLNRVFDLLPIAAVIDSRIVCMHGGLSPTLTYIEQITAIDRKREIDLQNTDLPPLQAEAIIDLTWSDPESVMRFVPNGRGKGQLFGANQTREFLRINGLGDRGFVARSHQIAQAGYQWTHDNKLVIVWSAPNYCYRAGNQASVMHVPAMYNNRKKVDFWKFEKDQNSHVKPPEVPFRVGYFA
jgi:diadenosine tetraphosphatase ApaH/serine/threonine PP2A family protein phosphatase